MGALTLAQYELPLSAYALDSTPVVDTLLHKKPTRASAQLPVISARLEYTALAPVNLDLPEPFPSRTAAPAAGAGVTNDTQASAKDNSAGPAALQRLARQSMPSKSSQGGHKHGRQGKSFGRRLEHLGFAILIWSSALKIRTRECNRKGSQKHVPLLSF